MSEINHSIIGQGERIFLFSMVPRFTKLFLSGIIRLKMPQYNCMAENNFEKIL